MAGFPAHAQTGNPSPGFTLMVSFSTVLSFMVIVLSAYMRLSANGLGCSDWPGCYATLLQVGEAGAGHSVSPAWATLVHRLVATTFGFLIIGMVIVALRRRAQPQQPVILPLLVFVLTVILSLLGYKTPAQLIPWVTMGNLLGGMAMLGMLWWLGLRPAVSTQTQRQGLRPWLIPGLIFGGLQLYLGAWNSANFAALACDSLTGCGAINWQEARLGDAFNLLRQLSGAGGHVVVDDNARIIHMAHRIGALLALFTLGWLALRAMSAGEPFRTSGIALLALLLVQLVLGLGAVYFGLPLGLVLMHNLVAALLLVSVLTLSHRVYIHTG